jgi:hypothetical protein
LERTGVMAVSWPVVGSRRRRDGRFGDGLVGVAVDGVKARPAFEEAAAARLREPLKGVSELVIS